MKRSVHLIILQKLDLQKSLKTYLVMLGFHIKLARIRQVVQKYLRIARRSNATRKNVVGLGKKVRVECDMESLRVAFDMQEVETSKSGIRRSKKLESTCRI